MSVNNPYQRKYKSPCEEYQEKLRKRNQTEEWIFGNSFGKPGGEDPLRDTQGNIISSLKSISDGNIYKYNPEDFSKGNNTISSIAQKNNENQTNINALNINNQFKHKLKHIKLIHLI